MSLHVEQEAYPWKHGIATLVAFVVAGIVPLVPFLLPLPDDARPAFSAGATMSALFGLGALRTLVTHERWWKTGIETLALGTVVALAAYAAGAVTALLARNL